jgi:hypothetical protein
MEIALTGMVRAHWTAENHVEWISALLEKEPRLDEAALKRTASQMDGAVPDCLVTNYESLIDDLELPDPNDRHVLAAAIKSSSECIVTANLKRIALLHAAIVKEWRPRAAVPLSILRSDTDVDFCRRLLIS